MWVVAALPPLAAPWGIDRPAACRQCGASRLVVHGHRRSPLPYVAARPNSAGEVAVTGYGTVRFKCQECGTTESAKWRSASATKVPELVRAKAVFWYALGDPLPAILSSLDHAGTPVSRATVYRLLQEVGDDRLRHFHRANARRRRVWSRRKPIRFFQGADIAVDEGDFAAAIRGRQAVIDPNSPYVAGALLVRTVAIVFRTYASRVLVETLQWLDAYMRPFGLAAIGMYRSRREIELLSRPEEPVPYIAPADHLVVRKSELNAPLDHAIPPIRNAVAAALRMADLGEPEIANTLRRGVMSSTRRRHQVLGHVDLEDIHEGAPSVRQTR